jgi:hypothetical protein
MNWPQSVIAKLLTIIFGALFFIVGMTLRRFRPSVDRYVQRKGWPLR